MAGTFRYLEEIALADLAFEAEGESVEEVFSGATQALLESMANPATVSGEWERAIERTDLDQSALLFDWLSEIVFWKDAAGVVFQEAPLTLTPKGKRLAVARAPDRRRSGSADTRASRRCEGSHETSVLREARGRALEGLVVLDI